MFVDSARVLVKAGDGGKGIVSFRRERYVSKGGPDGGDGGKGGDVVLVASTSENTLANFRHARELHAENGHNGANQKKHGRSGKDLVVRVPVGTQVLAAGTVIADLVDEGQQEIIAIGGKGGFGNAHFTSSVRQAPKIAELGEPGEEFEYDLELKTIADVGLVGLPNAGKSTLLSVISSAKPKIANYPFTTLNPHLGVVKVGESQLVVADIPGLIEGASDGKGLGDDFLRHVERTSVLLHIIDVYSDDPKRDYKTIRKELKNYTVDLSTKPQVVAFSKIEGIDEDIVADQVSTLQKAYPEVVVHTFSALSKHGLQPLLFELQKVAEAEKARLKAVEDEENEGLPVITHDQKQDETTSLEVRDEYVVLRGSKIERFAQRTDFANEEGVRRLRDIVRKLGIDRKLDKARVARGTEIYFGDDRDVYIEF